MHTIPVRISPEECMPLDSSHSGRVKRKRGTSWSPVSFGGWLVKVEGASVLAVRSADHEELSSSIFLVLGF